MRAKIKRTFNRDNLAQMIDLLYKLPEDEYLLIVYKEKQKRSLPQNRLLHMWFSILGEQLSQSAAYTKEQFKLTICPVEIADVSGKKMIIGKPTSEMSKEEMKNFLNETWRIAMDFYNIRLPLPEDLNIEQIVEAYQYE